MALTASERFGTVVPGFVTDLSGNLVTTGAGTTRNVVHGFVTDADGRLVTTTDPTGATWQDGFIRSPTGALVTTNSGTRRDVVPGFLTNDAGALVTTTAATQWREGFRVGANGELGVASSTYPELILSYGGDLGLYWRMGTSGITDSSSNARNGTALGGVTIGGAASLLPSETNGATTFDGIDDRVTATGWNMGQNYTVIAFVKTTHSGSVRQIVNRDVGARCFQFRISATGKLEFITLNASSQVAQATTTASINDDLPHMLVGTCEWSGSLRTARTYVDGVADGSQTNANAPLGDGGTFTVAADTGSFFPGTIDEVAIIHRVLTPTEISDLYAAALT